MRDDELRTTLDVVGRQGVIAGDNERVEIGPRLARRTKEIRAVTVAQFGAPRWHRTAEGIGDQWRCRPEGQHRDGRDERVRAKETRQHKSTAGDDRTRDHRREKRVGAHGAAAMGGGRRGFPLEHPPLRHDEPDERDENRVEHGVRVVCHERQLECRAREIRTQILGSGAQEEPPGLCSSRSIHEGCEADDDRECERRQGDGGPRRRAARQAGPAEEQQRDRGRRHEAAPEIVENFPARDQWKAVALHARPCRHEREQPEEDLPVSAHPPVLPATVGQHARRVVVHDFDICHEPGARIQPFEQVVRQERILRHAALQCRGECVDVVESLANEDAFVEEILVQVGYRRRVRVDPRVSRVRAGEQRPRCTRHRDADTRLKNAVAVGHATDRGIEVRAIQRMRQDADQFPGGLSRQARVGIQRQAVPDSWKDRERAGLHDEARVRRPSQQAVELFELAAFPFPAHPRVLARIPAPCAVEQEEAVGVFRAEAPVERLHTIPCRSEDRSVFLEDIGLGIAKVTEDREVDARVHVAEGEHFDMLQHGVGRRHAGEQCRHDHHRARVLWDAVGEVKPKETLRSNEPGKYTLRERDGDLDRRDHQEREGDDQCGRRRLVVPKIGGTPYQEQERHRCHWREIRNGRIGESEPGEPLREAWAVCHVGLEVGAPSPEQVVAHVRGPIRGRACRGRLSRAFDDAEGDTHLRFSGGARQLLDRLTLTVPA